MPANINMHKIMEDAKQALRNGIMFISVLGITLPIHFMHSDGFAQYGLMTDCGEIVRLVRYTTDHIEAFLV